MQVTEATNQNEWDAFLGSQRFRPFLQGWTMGEVYAATKQKVFRLEAREKGLITGICMAVFVPARRGRHLSIPYGPVVTNPELLKDFLQALSLIGKEHQCSFIRLSPFWADQESNTAALKSAQTKESPLHLLAEHLWYLPLTENDVWTHSPIPSPPSVREEGLLMNMRKTTRNLIRRAEKDGVTIEASTNPTIDIAHFLRLHDETRKRHGFTPYTDAFFREQVKHFAPRNECTLYLARYQDEIIASSIHIHAFGETSYHHGASTQKFRNVPASYLLQWTAIKDALQRGDEIYNFWGIAPIPTEASKAPKNHPFAGVTLFKTGFGGKLLTLVHCRDLPLSALYKLTRSFEIVRKWKRGF